MVNMSPDADAGAGPQADLARRNVRCDMQPEHGIDVRVFQRTVADHGDRAARRQLLRRLEEHLYCPGERVAPLSISTVTRPSSIDV